MSVYPPRTHQSQSNTCPVCNFPSLCGCKLVALSLESTWFPGRMVSILRWEEPFYWEPVGELSCIGRIPDMLVSSGVTCGTPRLCECACSRGCVPLFHDCTSLRSSASLPPESPSPRCSEVLLRPSICATFGQDVLHRAVPQDATCSSVNKCEIVLFLVPRDECAVHVTLWVQKTRSRHEH